MFNKILKAELVLLLFLIAVNGYVYLQTNAEPVTEVDQSSLEEGFKYLEYCNGGYSEQIVLVKEDSCIADLPGEFARGAIFSISLLVLVIFPTLHFLGILISNRFGKIKHDSETDK